MSDSTPLPKTLMLAIAVVQGLLLFALYKAFDAGVWPSKSPLWSYPLWTLAIAIPVLLLLTLERGNERRVIAMAVGFGTALASLAIYTGWQAEPFGKFPVFGLSFVFACSIAVACFTALIYLQQRAAQLPMSYQVLFTYSWRNFLVLALAALFVLVFVLILALWASLFTVINIELFAELFQKDWFLFPVLGFAQGLGFIIFRDLTRVIDNITKLLRGLIKLLLPIVVLVAVIFLLALPFTGLDVLWSTSHGTALLLWLLAIILFFINAVYQDGDANPYPPLVHRLIYLGLYALLPLCALSFYGLALRLGQYGWTVERCWGFLIWLFLTLFSAGYMWGIIARRAKWPPVMAKVSTITGLVVLALMLLANSPLLDFRKISLRSQLARVDSEEIPLEDFDFYYAHHYLARPGYLAFEQMKVDIGDSNPDLLDLLNKIENPQLAGMPAVVPNFDKFWAEFWAELIYRPAPFEVPVKVKAKIEEIPLELILSGLVSESVMIEIDLNGDGHNEYALIGLHEQGILPRGYYYYRTGEGWQEGNLNISWQGVADIHVIESLKEAQIKLKKPRFKDLEVGGVLLSPN